MTGIVPDIESITDDEIAQLREWLGPMHRDWRGVAIIRALMAQVQVMRSLLAHPATLPVPGRATFAQPERCGERQECALVDDAFKQGRGSLAQPHAWRCLGCGHDDTGMRN